MQQTIQRPTLMFVSQSKRYEILKRFLDIAISALALVLLAPLMMLCALAIQLDSPGPIFFRQVRAGKDSKEFALLKFRSMLANCDPRLHQEYVKSFIVQQESNLPTSDDSSLYKLTRDPRVTRVGRWLRKTSLDELPQLWNVLRGDMSLVGPRPPIAYELEHYTDDAMQRLTVKPGITGLWQVSGRSRTTFQEMVDLDMRYIATRSILMDLWIIVMTVPVVVLARDGC